MKILLSVMLPLIVWLPVYGQADHDWVNREIQMKRAALSLQRKLEKTVPLAEQDFYDAGFYGIDLEIDIPSETIAGRVTVRGRSLRDEFVEVVLDLLSPLKVDRVWGDAADFRQVNDKLIVQLQAPIDSGGVFDFGVAYGGNPVAGGLKGFTFAYHNNVPIVSTLSQPYFARGWFPCKDIPGDKVDSADIRLTVPDSLTAVSNGVLVDITNNSDGSQTFYWRERYPIASYLISLAVTNYRRIDQTYTALDGGSMPVYHWYYHEDEHRTSVLLLTPEMITFFASLWGEYPFVGEKYGHAQFSWGGGMEHQTCTSLGAYSELMICHELAHQWWGNMVTCADWSEIWLNEGFARYSEALWQEYRIGKEAYHDFMSKINRPSYWQPGPVYVVNTADVNSIFNLLVYDKGAWILHMLRGVVGDSIFFDIFPAYRDEYYMGVATTEDFQRVCEEVSGVDLDWFFQQWVMRPGQPNYKVFWERRKIAANQWRMSVRIDQIQSKTELFKMPLDMLVNFGKSDSLLRVWDSTASQVFQFQFADMPERITIDPDNWVLKTIQYSNLDPDIGCLPQEFLLSAPYPNPFNTAVSFDVYLPQSADIKIAIYDLIGCLVDTIIEGYHPAGYHEMSWKPSDLASGLYFIRLENNWINLSKKIVYLK